MLFAVLPYALVLYGAYATYITMAATDPVIFRFTFGGISVTCIAMVRESCLPPSLLSFCLLLALTVHPALCGALWLFTQEVKLYFDVADRKVRILFELGLGAFLLAFFVWVKAMHSARSQT